MLTYIVKRLVYTIPTLVVVAVMAFMIVHMIPGDPASTLLGTDVAPQQVEELRRQLGLDRPIYEQFVLWCWNLLQGNFGESFILKQPVIEVILERMPVTVELTILALIVSLVIGIPAGVLSAVYQGKPFDQWIMVVALIGLALPDFWLGLNLVSFLSVEFGWFPTGGYVHWKESVGAWLHHLLLPSFSLGFIHSALVTRMTRSAMLEVMRQEYIKTARAKGVPEVQVIMKHAFKNAMIPIVTVVGLSVTVLLGGAVVIENVFSLSGMGRLIVSAVKSRDFPIIQGAIVFIALMSVLVNLIVDLAYKWINPKLRFE